MRLLARDGIGLQVTTVAHDPQRTEEVPKVAGKAPLVIKLLEGTEVLGIVFADTDQSVNSVIDTFCETKTNIPVQEFTNEAGGTDICAIIIGGRVIAAMKRTGAEGELRSNLHRCGSAQLTKLSPEEWSTVVPAAKSMGLNMCGVDMLRANLGAIVMEVSSSPGLAGVENAAGLDIAGKITEFIDKGAKLGATKSKGKV